MPYFRGFSKKLKKIQKKSSKTLAFSAIIRYTVKAIEKEVQAIMAKCSCCGKGVTFGIKVSHSHRRSNRTWNPNVKRVKAIVDGSPKYIYACTRCLRSGKVTRAVWLEGKNAGHIVWPAFSLLCLLFRRWVYAPPWPCNAVELCKHPAAVSYTHLTLPTIA